LVECIDVSNFICFFIMVIQLESSLKSAKEAQDLLRSQADSARALMFKDEEFKSLQIQVQFNCWD
jgi:hypothetical protein